MTIIEQIRAEIDRRMKELRGQEKDFLEQDCHTLVEDARLRIGELNQLLSFLDTLEKSERPEPYNPVYDEAYLNEKIKKATESWKGVDVDAMLAECRGYDEEKSEKPMNQDLEKELALFYLKDLCGSGKDEIPEATLNHNFPIMWDDLRDIARHFAKWGKDQMLKEAVEYEVWDFSSSLEAYPHVNIPLDNKQYRSGDKVRVIVLPKEG